MRIIHTADIHLGAAPEKQYNWSAMRGKEIWETFAALVARVKELQPDLFIIAGDLFHRSPLERELREVSELLADISPIPVAVIAGNHDYIRDHSSYESFQWSENVIFFKKGDMHRAPVAGCGAEVYGLSYRQTQITEGIYDYVHPVDPKKINILVAHGGDELHAPIDYARLAESGFDYIALGHLHTPRWQKERNYAFPGSLEPIDMNETGEHGYLDVEVQKGACDVRFVPFARRNYRELVIPVTVKSTMTAITREISARMAAEGDHHMYRVRLVGERNPDFAVDIDSIYLLGNIVKVEDDTELSYDYEKLRRENEGNMLGIFISGFGDDDAKLSEMEKKARAYGVQALLNEE
ncbi:MAG: DNA repair exonuclease [Lachnospiraceae bacterium]|nr:DNA repair exonuclease [Lachnospiraceae bacterium]